MRVLVRSELNLRMSFRRHSVPFLRASGMIKAALKYVLGKNEWFAGLAPELADKISRTWSHQAVGRHAHLFDKRRCRWNLCPDLGTGPHIKGISFRPACFLADRLARRLVWRLVGPRRQAVWLRRQRGRHHGSASSKSRKIERPGRRTYRLLLGLRRAAGGSLSRGDRLSGSRNAIADRCKFSPMNCCVSPIVTDGARRAKS